MRLLLAHTVAHAPDASLTDSIWYHPDFEKPEHIFSAKPGVVLDSWVPDDGRVHVNLAAIKRSSSGLDSDTLEAFMKSLEYYVFPRVITLVSVLDSHSSVGSHYFPAIILSS